MENTRNFTNQTIEASQILSAFITAQEQTARTNELNGIDVVKVVYALGIDAFIDTISIQTLLADHGIKLKGGYNAENHFLAVVKLLAFFAHVRGNSGAFARFAAICKFAHTNHVCTEDIEPFVRDHGGLRAAYNASVADRKAKTAPKADDTVVDATVRIEIYSSKGFQGILNLSDKGIAKLVARHGLKITDIIPDNDDPNPPSNQGGAATMINDATKECDVVSCITMYSADIDNAPKCVSASNDNGPNNDPVFKQDWAITNLKTLNNYGQFEKRQKLLRGQIEADTPNGDVCLTADELWQAPLKALELDQYDLDVASPSEPPASYKGKWHYSPIQAMNKLTVEAGTFGGLDRSWHGVVWCNPPYGLYSWAVFCEKARLEVALGNADLVVCLVPATSGNISCHVTEELWDENAYEIWFNQRISFWMTKSNNEDMIAGSRFIVYGKPDIMRTFIPSFATELQEVGVIGPNLRAFHHKRANLLFGAVNDNAQALGETTELRCSEDMGAEVANNYRRLA